ncbi:MAG: hypothetical protein ACXWR1_20300, partial [Bdellovibrionota bacterium]
MRIILSLVAIAGLCSCTTVNEDRTNLSIPTAIRTQITFEPLDRNQAQTYLQSERQFYKTHVQGMIDRKAGLECLPLQRLLNGPRAGEGVVQAGFQLGRRNAGALERGRRHAI